MPEGDDRSSPQFHISTRLDDLCNEGQREMSEGDDRPSSEFDMSTRVDDMCNDEQRIYVTTVDVMLFSFTCLSSMVVGIYLTTNFQYLVIIIRNRNKPKLLLRWVLQILNRAFQKSKINF